MKPNRLRCIAMAASLCMLSAMLQTFPAFAARRSSSRSGGDTSSETETEIGTPGVSQMDSVNADLVPVDDGKVRTTYEIFVYSFADSDGDGIGDLRGITDQLDYLGEELGVDALWLTPVFPSPTYHKYDAVDYEAIDPEFGTLEDYELLLAEAHTRGMEVYMDLAVNHTSTQHPWFEEAADYLRNLESGEQPAGEACPYIDYYHFSETAQDGYVQLEDTDWYYEARFWSGMPDLNLDSEAVRAEIAGITAFWLGMGVDGFRLDAVTSYYTGQTSDNITFLAWLSETVKNQNQDAYLVGECWTDQSSYARYYESGIDSFFDFRFAGGDGLIADVVRGAKSASNFAAALVEEEALYAEYNAAYINAPFYTNHDIDRSAGYYAYDDGSRTKLAMGLNLLMQGNVFLYYGEELGMKGSGIDENKRVPMYWTDTTDSAYSTSMCSGPDGMDEIVQKFGSLEEQKEDPLSVWNYVKNAVLIRESIPVIADGQTISVEAELGRGAGAFVKVMQMDESADVDTVLVVYSTSEQRQEVDLSQVDFDGRALKAVLTAGYGEVVLEGDILSLPAFGIAVLE